MEASSMSQERLNILNSTVEKERARLFNFIRKRVPRTEDAEDILQDVLYQFVNTYDTVGSIEKVTAWLFRVARNRITDSYRKKKPELLGDKTVEGGDDEGGVIMLEDILPDFSSLPDEMMAREMVWEELEHALDELPEEQRFVFIQHEFEDKSFNEISEITGVSVNTLLSRKRYAIMYLREKLRTLYEEL